MAEEDLITIAINRITLDKDLIKENHLGKIEVESFKIEDFWTQFGTVVQSLSNEVTKISFMCGKKPFPDKEEVTGMLQDMMQYYNMMKELYQVLPENVGMAVYKAVSAAVSNIVSALLDIVKSLKDLSDKGARERLTLTGTFWDACNAVEKLPKNNLEATEKVLEEERSLAADAQEELTTTIEEDRVNMSEIGDVDNSELWTNPERELATNAVGLVKVTQHCVQRVLTAVRGFGSCATPEHCAELDQMATAVRAVSPALDDFVSELYHPIDVSTALENARKLVEVLQGVLSTAKSSHFREGISDEVFSKLAHFISHNHHKIDPDASNPVPGFSSLTTLYTNCNK